MNSKKINIFALLICYLFLFSSCREEIIAPLKPDAADRINNPVQSATSNSYSFSINAQSNSSFFIDAVPVLPSLDLSLSLDNYSGGYVYIFLTENNGRLVYSDTCGANFNNSSINLDGFLPSRIELQFENFSGNFSFKAIR